MARPAPDVNELVRVMSAEVGLVCSLRIWRGWWGGVDKNEQANESRKFPPPPFKEAERGGVLKKGGSAWRRSAGGRVRTMKLDMCRLATFKELRKRICVNHSPIGYCFREAPKSAYARGGFFNAPGISVTGAGACGSAGVARPMHS